MTYDIDTWRNGTEQHGLSVATAAGLLADWETITVAGVATESNNWLERGEASPALTLVLWGNPLAGEPGEPRFVMRWASGTPVPPGSAEATTMHRVIDRAQQSAALAEKLRDQEDGEVDGLDSEPADEPDGVTDRAVTEVAIALGRHAELHPDPVTLTHEQTLRLARHAMERLCLIRDRDGTDPLPRSDGTADGGYDPVQDLVMVTLSAARSPQGLSPAAAVGLGNLRRELDLDGAEPAETWFATVRSALEAGHGA